jgi:DNA repair exonuclease SbcCD ATPase subunit
MVAGDPNPRELHKTNPEEPNEGPNVEQDSKDELGPGTGSQGLTSTEDEDPYPGWTFGGREVWEPSLLNAVRAEHKDIADLKAQIQGTIDELVGGVNEARIEIDHVTKQLNRIESRLSAIETKTDEEIQKSLQAIEKVIDEGEAKVDKRFNEIVQRLTDAMKESSSQRLAALEQEIRSIKESISRLTQSFSRNEHQQGQLLESIDQTVRAVRLTTEKSSDSRMVGAEIARFRYLARAADRISDLLGQAEANPANKLGILTNAVHEACGALERLGADKDFEDAVQEWNKLVQQNQRGALQTLGDQKLFQEFLRAERNLLIRGGFCAEVAEKSIEYIQLLDKQRVSETVRRPSGLGILNTVSDLRKETCDLASRMKQRMAEIERRRMTEKRLRLICFAIIGGAVVVLNVSPIASELGISHAGAALSGAVGEVLIGGPVVFDV